MEAQTPSLTVIPRPQHVVSRANISPNAVSVLYHLHRAGYRACLVGGGVRDLLLGREPKDFDVVTDAKPEQIYHLFRNARLIGRRFRLAHVRFGQEIVEVATFRACSDVDNEDDGIERAADGRILSDNVYGSIEEDAWRRDFTINALYYDIANFAVLDYVGGIADLEAGLIRLIGDPAQRYHEDPVRMLRAVRFAAKLGLRIDPATEAPLHHLGHLLAQIPPARLSDEVLKLFMGGSALQTFELLRHYRLFGWLFPATERCLSRQQQHYPKTLLVRALGDIDRRIADNLPVNPAFLFAALMWEPLREQQQHRQEQGLPDHEALQEAIDDVVQAQIPHVALPRRCNTMREIWEMQPRLAQITGKRPLRLVTHPRFRAAYDFLVLRAETDEGAAELAEWWTRFLRLDEAGRVAMTQPPKGKGKKSKPRRRRKPRSASPDAARPTPDA
ncbi:MAG TPA: polynucleotide adenylyltransferase PcnB [Gammaproteobacteria bacterium]|nr:polynucleotide adenylyltransferase PcnB [Gammaproteobacteria bacterium]